MNRPSNPSPNAPSLLLPLALALALAGCSSELVCPVGEVNCGGACAALFADVQNCGACGTPCGAGQSCSGGACVAGEPGAVGVQVACGATDEVVPRTATLGLAGPSRAVSPGPTALATLNGVVYSASGYPAATVDYLAADLRLTAPVHRVPLAGSDLQGIAAHEGAIFVANSGVGTLVVLSPDGQVIDELPMGDTQTGPNPRGMAFTGGKAYVALGGSNDTSGQAVAVVDLAGLPACLAEGATSTCSTDANCPAGRHCVDGACRLHCGALEQLLDLKAIPGASDAPGAPFPSRALAAGGKVYVTLGNLKFADFGGGFSGWFEPAGSGKLAILDPAAGDAISVLDLGPDCGNPGALAASGDTLWVACGSLSFSSAWPARLLPVSIAGAPAAGAALDPSPVIPNGVVICGGVGYVPDMASGLVRRFDLSTGTFEPPVEVCPVGPFDFAYVSDLVCTP